ncbi:MAG: hypothetical protein J5798_11555 [Spirochaetaceae bacterium]|nr:hypothetical protein [Spirochaetaceae bacterium]MBR4825587.1 hypothetical protein [Spirochaetaceae bacterium]
MKKSISIALLFLLLQFLTAHEIDCECEDDEFGIYHLIPNKVSATSTLVEKNKSPDFYSAENLYDASWKSWVEGEKADGLNSEIVYQYNSPKDIRALVIRNGYGELRYFYQNNRVKDIQLSDGKSTYKLTLRDTYLPQIFEIEFNSCTEIKIKILSVYKGTKYSDTCLAELRFLNYPVQDDRVVPYAQDDFTKTAIRQIPGIDVFPDYFAIPKFRTINYLPRGEFRIGFVMHYLENGRLLLLEEHQNQIKKGNNQNNWKWEYSGTSFYEFDGEKWILSNDPAFDIIKQSDGVHLKPFAIDEYPHKMDFCYGGNCFKLTDTGFEQVFEWVKPSDR